MGLIVLFFEGEKQGKNPLCPPERWKKPKRVCDDGGLMDVMGDVRQIREKLGVSGGSGMA